MYDGRQVDVPCPFCGSWYRKGGACNKCGSPAPVKSAEQEEKNWNDGKSARGRAWDSKLHRYVKAGEVLTR